MEYVYIIIIVVFAVQAVSELILWNHKIEKSWVKMAIPTSIFIEGGVDSKIQIKTLLYSLSGKGQYVEDMHISVFNNNGEGVVFDYWKCDDQRFSRKKGLELSRKRTSTRHEFSMSEGGSGYKYKPGKCTIQVFAQTKNRNHKKILEFEFMINEKEVKEINKDKGAHFIWCPHSMQHLPDRPQNFK